VPETVHPCRGISSLVCFRINKGTESLSSPIQSTYSVQQITSWQQAEERHEKAVQLANAG